MNGGKDIDIYNAFALGSLIDGINGGIKISYNESKFPFYYVSEAMAAIQGYTPEELMKKHPTAVGNGRLEDIAPIAQKMLEDFAKTGRYTAKYRVQHKDGRWIWVQDHGKLVKMPDGREFVYSLIQDIDTAERSKLSLVTERSMFREALTKNALYTIVADITTGQITERINTQNSRDLFPDYHIEVPSNFDEEGKIFCKTFDLVPIGEMPANFFCAADIKRLFDEGVTFCTQEYYLRAIDTYIRVDGYSTRDPLTNHIISNGICFDITEQKKQEMA
ncbi:MAG: PAS domain-containing protein, partial [Bacteroidia bacterium]|nr:PAS domain-containing protein [Bacteroidia bacterium]